MPVWPGFFQYTCQPGLIVNTTPTVNGLPGSMPDVSTSSFAATRSPRGAARAAAAAQSPITITTDNDAMQRLMVRISYARPPRPLQHVSHRMCVTVRAADVTPSVRDFTLAKMTGTIRSPYG